MKRALQPVLWVAVVLGAAYEVRVSFIRAAAQIGGDFSGYYLPAAKRLEASGNPYDIVGYTYSPLVAMLIRPFASDPVARLSHAWSGAMVACLFAAAATTGLWKVSDWRRPVLTGVAVLTLFKFWPTTISLFLGQADPIVLAVFTLAIAAAMYARQVLAAVLLGLCGVLKTWPVLFGLGMLGRPIQRRALVTLVLTALAAPGLALVLGSSSWVWGMAHGSVDNASQQLISHSVWGFADLTFRRTGLAEPLVTSLPLKLAIALALALVLIAVVVRLQQHAADQATLLVHVAPAAVLLVPVSHLGYLIFVLPLLWYWVARALRQEHRSLAGLAVLSVWWLVAERPWPDNGSGATLSALRYDVPFLVTYASSVASALLATHRTDSHAQLSGRIRSGRPEK